MKETKENNGTSKRGFASMPAKQIHDIASKGGIARAAKAGQRTTKKSNENQGYSKKLPEDGEEE